MSQTFSVKFTKKQIEYLMQKTGATTPDEAIETFMTIVSSEYIEPSKIASYIKKLMDKDGVK